MNDPGTPSAPQRLGEPSNDEGEIPLRVLFVAIALMLILVAVTGWVLTRPDKADAGASYPSTWDARITPYVKKTEKLRGLMFLHPVEVKFLPAAEFKKTLEADRDDFTKEELDEVESYAGVLRAAGLLKGNPDLFDAANDFHTNGTLAYYSPEDQTVTIRGKKITPGIRSTVVHELTHALQDQHFSIGDRMADLNQDPDAPSTSQASVLDGIIEGDAERVQTLYRESLTAKQRKALDASSQDEYDEAQPAIRNVPKILLTMMTSSYTLGQALVQTADVEGGNSAVDDLFRDTPKNELALLDPFTALAHSVEATDLEIPSLKEDADEIMSGEFGATMWYFMLAERLPLTEALAAADGWGGDAFVAYDGPDGKACVSAIVTGAGPRDTQRLSSALTRWIAAAPGTHAEVAKTGSAIHFHSCDPGKRAKIGKDVSEQAVLLSVTRTYSAIALMRRGLEADVSRCVAGRLVDSYRLSDLNDAEYATKHPEFASRLRSMVAACQ